MYRLDELSKLETCELSTLFVAMQDNLNIVTHFREDVCYDYTTIAQAYFTEDFPSDYTWVVRDCGTWLVNKQSSMYENYMDSYKSNYEHFEQYNIHIEKNNLVLERLVDYNHYSDAQLERFARIHGYTKAGEN